MSGRGVSRWGGAVAWVLRGALAFGALTLVVAGFAACEGGDVIIGIVAPVDDAGTTATRSAPSPVPTALTAPDGSLPAPAPDADVFDAYAGPCLSDGACPAGSSCDYDSGVGVGECINHQGPPAAPPPGGG